MQDALWKIEGLEALDVDTYKKCVVRIHFSVTNKDRMFTGDQHIIFSNENFVLFENLTEEIVMQWLKDGLGAHGVLKIENKLIEVQTQSATKSIAQSEALAVEIPW